MEGAIDSLESELGRRSEELRAREADAGRLEFELQETRSRLSQARRQTDAIRDELTATHERADGQLESLAVVGRQLDELRAGARGQATRIRLRALREAAILSLRAADVEATAWVSLGARRDRLLDALEEAIDRVASDWEPEDAGDQVTAANGFGHPIAASSAGRADRHRVSVDVGPFEDFSQLVRFEDAANAIGATGDISIKRFSEGRARIDVGLSEPVDLLRELEERCDLEFKVRSAADDEIVLDVD